MTFVDDNGNAIEVPGQFAMTKQAVTIFNFTIVGDVSLNFEVDDNSTNRKTLNYDGQMMLNQIAFTRQAFNRMRNNNVIDRGFIVIQDEDEATGKLNCFYISGNSNFINFFSGLITQLDFSSYRKQWTSANIQALMPAVSGMTFPVADFCYKLNKGNNAFRVSKIYDSQSTYQPPSSTPDYDIQPVDNPFYTEFYPAFFLSTLFQEIFTQNNIKLSGNIVNDPVYKSMILPAYQAQIKRDAVPQVSATGALFTASASSTYELYNLFSDSYDPESLMSASRYVAIRTTLMYVIVECTSNPDDHIMDYQIRKNGIAVGTFSTTTLGSSPVPPGSIATFEIPVAPGDYLEVWVFSDVVLPSNCQISLNIKFRTPQIIGPNDYISPNDFLYPFKSVDILKFVVNFFGCSVYFDVYSKSVSINIIEKLKPESAVDWSDFFLSARNEYTVDSAQNNYVKLEDPDDIELTAYNKLNSAPYGGGNITTGNTLKPTNDLFKIPFGASLFGKAKSTSWMSDIGFISFDNGDSISYTGITNGGPAALYTVAVLDNVFVDNEIVKIFNSSNDLVGYYIVKQLALGTVEFWGLNYTSSDTGTIVRLKMKFSDIKPRILVTKYTSVPDFSDLTTIDLYEVGSTTSLSSVQHAFFAKPFTGKNIDFFKMSCSWGEINNSAYTDPVMQELYFGKIKNMLGNPNVRSKMILPEATFQTFDFSFFIYLNTRKFQGYFFIKSIVNYANSNTPVEVNLYKL